MTAESNTTYGSIPLANAVAIVSVTAPSTMKEGFVFDAMHNNVIFQVTVPAGGVREGDIIDAPFNPLVATAVAGSPGKWKDDVLACTRYGICHPSFLCALCCKFVLLAQVMTRLNIDWKAAPAAGDEWKNTFRNVVVISCVYGVANFLLKHHDGTYYIDDCSPLLKLVHFAYFGYMLYVISKTRKLVRQRDGIPAKHCEDAACAFFCGCCTVSQMARQTADYDTEEAAFFTSDGLGAKTYGSEQLAPVIIV